MRILLNHNISRPPLGHPQDHTVDTTNEWGWSELRNGESTGMGVFRITVEIGDQSGHGFRELETLVDTGATFTRVPRSILEALDIPRARTYTALLADGRRVPREQGWATIRLEGQQFPTPVTFGEEGEPTLLGTMALDQALLAVDPHGQRLIPVNALEVTSTGVGEVRQVHC